ncbi:RES family NAD+ phosphorylase [Planctellipticum variicoloris]|uniref:RES family NAD+ phosphorylase n=1 Tax=Planctellipticum variicoloris TaxID=3064265 RepID=UPI0030135153|nr:RES family NAD+ phosphorylase [Planctomycetaceae bacterium SH412]
MAGDPTFDQLKTRLKRLLPTTEAYTGRVYRSSTPRYAKESDLLNGAGGRRTGGRWNPVGIAVVYASLTPETAMAETLAHYRYYAIGLEDAMPRTFVAIDARLQAVLDLRLGTVRQRLQVSLDRILKVDWRKEVQAGREPITQVLGRAASDVGLEGLIVPSAASPDGQNLLVFPKNLQTGSELRVLSPERLAQ